MPQLIIGIILLLCLIGYFIWWNSGYFSFSGFTWLLVVVIIPVALFIIGIFLTVAGLLNLLGM